MAEVSAESGVARSSVWLWVIIGVGVALRLWGVLVHPVDQDELYTVMESTDLFRTALQPGIQSRPLYYLVQHALFWMSPSHEPWTRLLPLVAGGVGIWLVSRITARLADERAALVAALAVACSPWHAYASETARYYSVIFALVAATMLLVFTARERDTASSWARASVPVVIGTLVHPAFVLATAVPLAWSLFRGPIFAPRWRWPSRARWIGFVLPVVGGGAVLLLSIVLFRRETGVSNGGVRLIDANLRLVPAILEWASPVLVAAGALGLLLIAVRKPRAHGSERDASDAAVSAETRRREAASTLARGAASTVALVAIASTATAAYADYAIGLLPALCVGAGLLAWWLTQSTRAPVVGLLVAAGMAPSLISHVVDGSRFDYRPAFAVVREEAPHQLMLTWPVAIGVHYAADLRRGSLAQSPAVLDSILASEQQLWAVASFKRFGLVTDGGDGLRQWLQAHCVEQQSFERLRFDVRQYRVSLQTCRAPSTPR